MPEGNKESIFTGLNNLEIISIMNKNYAEYFGFTPKEVESMLCDYGIEGKSDEVKQWYDGYLFGNTEVYNPWEGNKLCESSVSRSGAFPEATWANTSSNKHRPGTGRTGGRRVKQEMEELIAGGSIEKPVHEDITYDEVYKTEDNLWNFLFLQGI